MEARDAARANHGPTFKAFPLPSRTGLRDPLSQPDSKVILGPGPRHRRGERASSSPGRRLGDGDTRGDVGFGAGGFSRSLFPFRRLSPGVGGARGQGLSARCPPSLRVRKPAGFSPVWVTPDASPPREPRSRRSLPTSA